MSFTLYPAYSRVSNLSFKTSRQQNYRDITYCVTELNLAFFCFQRKEIRAIVSQVESNPWPITFTIGLSVFRSLFVQYTFSAQRGMGARSGASVRLSSMSTRRGHITEGVSKRFTWSFVVQGLVPSVFEHAK